MRHLTFRVLILLLMVGFLTFSNTGKSQAVACNGSCYQSCYNEYTACINLYGSGGFFYCCEEFNACHEACGTCPPCELPQPYPPE